MKERITPSPHDLYKLGYRCATMGIPKRSENVSWSKPLKIPVVWIIFCNSKI